MAMTNVRTDGKRALGEAHEQRSLEAIEALEFATTMLRLTVTSMEQTQDKFGYDPDAAFTTCVPTTFLKALSRYTNISEGLNLFLDYLSIPADDLSFDTVLKTYREKTEQSEKLIEMFREENTTENESQLTRHLT